MRPVAFLYRLTQLRLLYTQSLQWLSVIRKWTKLRISAPRGTLAYSRLFALMLGFTALLNKDPLLHSSWLPHRNSYGVKVLIIRRQILQPQMLHDCNRQSVVRQQLMLDGDRRGSLKRR